MKENLKQLKATPHCQFVKIYLPRPEQDRFLVETVRPLVRRIVEEDKAFRYFFYIRYADPDSHLRLRFFGDRASVLGSPRRALLAALEAGLRGIPGASVVNGRYRPEWGRYGGRVGVRLAERLFAASSRAALDFLAYRDSKDEAASKIEFALVSGEMLVSAMGLTSKAKQEAFSLPRLDDQTRVRLEALADKFGPMVRRAAAAPERYWSGNRESQEIVSRFRQETRFWFKDPGSLARLVRLPFPALAVSYLHMHYNRLGIVPQEEKLIRSLRARCVPDARG